MRKVISVISDTHGLLRPNVIPHLQGSELIIHAGDMGDPAIIDRLKTIAPVVAVRGNVDVGEWARKFPLTKQLEMDNTKIFVIHDLGKLPCDLKSQQISVVISGHSHRPRIHEKDGVTYLNPGSIGPRRFNLPISLAKLELADGTVFSQLVELDD